MVETGFLNENPIFFFFFLFSPPSSDTLIARNLPFSPFTPILSRSLLTPFICFASIPRAFPGLYYRSTTRRIYNPVCVKRSKRNKWIKFKDRGFSDYRNTLYIYIMESREIKKTKEEGSRNGFHGNRVESFATY